MGWSKLTKFRYDPGFYNVICNIMVNLDRWKKLDKKQQEAKADEAAKAKRKQDVFPQDCQKAFAMGVRLAGNTLK